MPVAAVITADIVNSTVPGTVMGKKLIRKLNAVLENYKTEYYRGDSFQVYIRHPAEVLSLVYRLRTTARKLSEIYDIRISVGIGQVAGQVRDLRTAGSEAFVLSGRLFDQLRDTQYLGIRSANETANIALRVIAQFSDYLLKKFTSKQAEVILELLKGQTQAMIAKKLKREQSTIHKHIHSAGWPEMEKLLYEYHQLLTQFKLI
ncbi:MAG: hypothetical protein M9933_02265 [Chitinophagaceae bacterium]|nr:hypothetical protein [Chitinophagaceae bacterium]